MIRKRSLWALLPQKSGRFFTSSKCLAKRATSLRQASLKPEEVVTLDLTASQDFLCTNLFCEHVGGSCTCKLARWLDQTAPRLTSLSDLILDDNGLTSLSWIALAKIPKLRRVSLRFNNLDPSCVGLGKSGQGRSSAERVVFLNQRSDTCSTTCLLSGDESTQTNPSLAANTRSLSELSNLSLLDLGGNERIATVVRNEECKLGPILNELETAGVHIVI